MQIQPYKDEEMYNTREGLQAKDLSSWIFFHPIDLLFGLSRRAEIHSGMGAPYSAAQLQLELQT